MGPDIPEISLVRSLLWNFAGWEQPREGQYKLYCTRCASPCRTYHKVDDVDDDAEDNYDNDYNDDVDDENDDNKNCTMQGE